MYGSLTPQAAKKPMELKKEEYVETCGTTRFGGDPVMTPVPPMLAA
jgi:hypothetical protein